MRLPYWNDQVERCEVQERISELPVEVRRLPADENNDEQCELSVPDYNTRTATSCT